MLLNNNNLHQFLTTRRANSQKPNKNNSIISNNVKSKSNANISNIQKLKKHNIFTNINPKSKEKKSHNLNNQNLKTDINKKNPSKPPTELKFNISLLNITKNKRNSFKTLNYDRSPFIRIMKYFTIKSNNKPMKLDELSPVLIPIRNTLSNEHRTNSNNDMNINNENIKDKINFFNYINKKQKALQLFTKDEKINKYNCTDNSQRNGSESEKDEQKNQNRNNDGDNKINLIYKNDFRNNNFKGSENNLTFSKNSNESEFTFKDKGSTAFNMENKRSSKKDNGSDSSHNNIDLNNNTNFISEKDKDKIFNNKLSLINNLGKNNDISKNSGNPSNYLSISIDKINNKQKFEQKNIINSQNNNNNYNKNILKFNYSLAKNEEKKSNYENTPKFINEKFFNNFINKETNEIIKNEKSSNLLDKILNNQNIKNEKEINSKKSNNNIIIDKNDGLKNSYQFRIRKINLPIGLNLASIQQNSKLLQSIINKKSKKTNEVQNKNKIL